MTPKDIIKITGLPVFVASLCCFTPLIFVLFGLSSVAFASSLADILYGQYKWMFRTVGFILLAVSLFIYFRKRGICTIDQAQKNRRQIINTILIAIIVFILGYMIWLYVVVEYIGVFLGIWG